MRAQVMDVRSVARFIVNHSGVGIIPQFLLNTIREEGYDIFNFKGKADTLTNKIQMVYLKNRTHRSSSTIVMDELRLAFAEGLSLQPKLHYHFEITISILASKTLRYSKLFSLAHLPDGENCI